MTFKRLKNIILFDTFGSLAISSLLICGLSGIVLAIPFDIKNPYLSISSFLITNPGAVFFRNLHYWSAQFFLVFILLHIWDHFRKNTEKKTKKGVWFRLTLSIAIIFLVMVSGFILKADADSLQALRILRSLIEEIPILGSTLADILIGSEDNFLVLYVHHIATFTIFILIILFEHARKIWGKRLTFIILMVLLSVVSMFFHAPLHDGIHPTLKGPWYFVGLQEILHWFSNPLYVIVFLLMVLGIIFSLKYLKQTWNHYTKLILYFLTGIYAILTIVGFYFRGENWEWSTPWTRNMITQTHYINTAFFWEENPKIQNFESGLPTVKNRAESCLICHDHIEGFSPAHDPLAIGCTACHLGNPFSLNKEWSHQRMIKIPGQLQDADLTCGTADCHPREVTNVHQSIMTTASGLISVDKVLFGESNTFDTLFHITELGYSAAEKHLRDLCASCHLGNIKKEAGPIHQRSRGGGCLACHLNYSGAQTDSLHQYLAANKNTGEHFLTLHPSIDIQIDNNHCFGCHSRSGRISTSYEGWHETQLDRKDVDNNEIYRILEDKRVFTKVQADIHHEKGMLCIDCHTSHEVMGDGKTYFHKEEAVKVQCEDCHFEGPANTIEFENLDDESNAVFRLRAFDHMHKPMLINSGDRPLVNTYVDDGNAWLIGKKDLQLHPLNPPGKVCTTGSSHDDLLCSACHTSWAPQCLGCHNVYDPASEGYDLLDNQFITGEWKEYIGEFIAESPALGVKENAETREIHSAIPGMIMTIDIGSYPSGEEDQEIFFHRLYAPSSPHTIVTEGRTCISCHLNPLAIGYGRGKLEYQVQDKFGKWSFTPLYAINPEDNLPEDAWTGFLNERTGLVSTRSDFRPFNLDEQKRILTVGACLNCHDEHSVVVEKMLETDFTIYLEQLSDQCVLPVF